MDSESRRLLFTVSRDAVYNVPDKIVIVFPICALRVLRATVSRCRTDSDSESALCELNSRQSLYVQAA